mmetsp:Transcript_38924/g.94250  ORF Transcript_38924/g.94250 Transcript_38924/m.94250 type:complete len:118 (+) Transcript_38924:964-1317(+)
MHGHYGTRPLLPRVGYEITVDSPMVGTVVDRNANTVGRCTLVSFHTPVQLVELLQYEAVEVVVDAGVAALSKSSINNKPCDPYAIWYSRKIDTYPDSLYFVRTLRLVIDRLMNLDYL